MIFIITVRSEAIFLVVMGVGYSGDRSDHLEIPGLSSSAILMRLLYRVGRGMLGDGLPRPMLWFHDSLGLSDVYSGRERE